MRRPFTLVCIAALLIAALALPTASVGLATLDVALWAPSPASAAPARSEPELANVALAPLAALLPFRGPPSSRRFLESSTEEPLREVVPCERTGWPGSWST